MGVSYPRPERGAGPIARAMWRAVSQNGSVEIEAPDDPTTSLRQLRAPVSDFVGREREIQPARQFGVGREHLSQLYKRAHDLDLDGYCPLAS